MKGDIIISYILFVTASILGIILAINRRYIFLPNFPHFDFFGKIYVEHIIAGFLLPIYLFILICGILVLFNKEILLNWQKSIIIITLFVTLGLSLLCEWLVPLFNSLKLLVVQNYPWQVLIMALNQWFLNPYWEIIQFLSDLLGIFLAILFIRKIREDLS